VQARQLRLYRNPSQLRACTTVAQRVTAKSQIYEAMKGPEGFNRSEVWKGVVAKVN